MRLHTPRYSSCPVLTVVVAVVVEVAGPVAGTVAAAVVVVVAAAGSTAAGSGPGIAAVAAGDIVAAGVVSFCQLILQLLRPLLRLR